MPITNLVECAVNLAEKVTGVDIDRDGDIGMSKEQLDDAKKKTNLNVDVVGATATLPDISATTPKVSLFEFKSAGQERTSNESGASTTLPVFDAATPKVSILAIGKNTLASANELLEEAEQQAANFQPQATEKAKFMLQNYAAGPGSTGNTTTDLTTGIAAWKLLDDGSKAPETDPYPTWYQPTGEGKWLGSATFGEANKVFGYTLSFEVTAPEVASFSLAFAVDNLVESATLNGKDLTVAGRLNAGFGNLSLLELDPGSALFKLGTNVLVVNVLNAAGLNNERGGPYGFYAEGAAKTGPTADLTKCTLANTTGARLEFFENGSTGFLSHYKPPKILEPGAVASFLVDKDSFALQYNIQVFQGPIGGWTRVEDSKTVTLGLKPTPLNPTTKRSAEIESDVQVIGDGTDGRGPPAGKPPAKYPTKFVFAVEDGDLVQIVATQEITQIPRG